MQEAVFWRVLNPVKENPTCVGLGEPLPSTGTAPRAMAPVQWGMKGLAGRGGRDTQRRQRAGAVGESTRGRPQAGVGGPALGGSVWLQQVPWVSGGSASPAACPTFLTKDWVSSCVLLRNDPGALLAGARPPCFHVMFSRRTRPLSPTGKRWALPCGLCTLHVLLPEPGRQPRPSGRGDRLAPRSGARLQAWASARGQRRPTRPQQATCGLCTVVLGAAAAF